MSVSSRLNMSMRLMPAMQMLAVLLRDPMDRDLAALCVHSALQYGVVCYDFFIRPCVVLHASVTDHRQWVYSYLLRSVFADWLLQCSHHGTPLVSSGGVVSCGVHYARMALGR